MRGTTLTPAYAGAGSSPRVGARGKLSPTTGEGIRASQFDCHIQMETVLANECEMCGSREDVQVHHVRALRDLNVKGQRRKPKWVEIMAARRRKTLVVCRTCHLNAHDGSWKPRKQ